ncbi:MAG: hypothetical protein HN509_17130 [Halobacteriovoraceae bacterium]|nr:hypothetical protein [Halobacteriovoraceae bacterium]MBT5093971.1 hypothetical protein [Halobacteriovoraceae bacterium]
MRKEEKIRWKSGDKQIKESLLTTITKRQSQDPDQLAEKNCIPCQGKVAPLSNEACQVLLKKINEGWSLDEAGTRLSNSYKFSDYKSAWDLVNSISELSEEQWHHPQITFGWGFLEIQIWTHQIDALVESDFVLAAKIDLLQAST